MKPFLTITLFQTITLSIFFVWILIINMVSGIIFLGIWGDVILVVLMAQSLFLLGVAIAWSLKIRQYETFVLVFIRCPSRTCFCNSHLLLFVCWHLESKYSKWRLEMENGQETCH